MGEIKVDCIGNLTSGRKMEVSKLNYNERLEEIKRLADGLESRTTQLQEAAALDAGFPVKITSVEV